LPPTEAASVDSVGALMLCARRRRLNGEVLRNSLVSTLQRCGVDGPAILGKAQAIVRKINEDMLARCGECGEACQ
jgi:TRAP-type mannitol/chloroaromatic compound transport system permease large subunit